MKFSYDLTGKVAVVTGGAEGLGRELSTTLSEYGATVYITARSADKLEKAAKEISAATGNNVLPYPCDVTNEDQVSALMQYVVKESGSLDILVNNAGAITYGAPEEISLAEWNKVMNTDCTGQFLCCREAGKAWMIAHGGKIVNIASISGLRASKRSCIYSAAKAASISLTTSIAAAWAQYNIFCNAISPGSMSYGGMNKTQTDEMRASISKNLPQGRVGMYGDLSGALMYLVSDANTYTQGQNICCDGGLVLCQP